MGSTILSRAPLCSRKQALWGVLLAGIVVAILYAMGGHIVEGSIAGLVPFPMAEFTGDPAEAEAKSRLMVLFNKLLEFNILWGLLNLLPVFPLDGGQIAQAAMVAKDPWGGLARSLWLSVFTGGIVAVVGGLVLQNFMMAMMFGSARIFTRPSVFAASRVSDFEPPALTALTEAGPASVPV